MNPRDRPAGAAVMTHLRLFPRPAGPGWREVRITDALASRNLSLVEPQEYRDGEHDEPRRAWGIWVTLVLSLLLWGAIAALLVRMIR
jgi:hypothetical protein